MRILHFWSLTDEVEVPQYLDINDATSTCSPLGLTWSGGTISCQISYEFGSIMSYISL